MHTGRDIVRTGKLLRFIACFDLEVCEYRQTEEEQEALPTNTQGLQESYRLLNMSEVTEAFTKPIYRTSRYYIPYSTKWFLDYKITIKTRSSGKN
jgi:hypothetical protein